MFYVAKNNETYYDLYVECPTFVPDFNQIWIFMKVPNIKFHGNPFSESRADTFGRTDIYINRRADMKQIREACRDYEKAPKYSVTEENGFLQTQPLNEHPLPLLHYCGMGDRPRGSSIFQNQLL